MKFLKMVLLMISVCVMIPFGEVHAEKAPEPTKKIILFYRVNDAILACQNKEENLQEGQAEFEEELQKNYSKRFIVNGIHRTPPELKMPEYYKSFCRVNEEPFVISIQLEGEGTRTDSYQNAFGASAYGVSKTVNVHLVEYAVPRNDEKNYSYDYGALAYGKGTFAIGRDIFAADSDPRRNTKDAVKGCIRDACKFNAGEINKYANPEAYEREVNRFKGNFKPLVEADEKRNAAAQARIDAFMAWCDAGQTPEEKMLRQQFKIGMINFPTMEDKLIYINTLINYGHYKEEA